MTRDAETVRRLVEEGQLDLQDDETRRLVRRALDLPEPTSSISTPATSTTPAKRRLSPPSPPKGYPNARLVSWDGKTARWDVSASAPVKNIPLPKGSVQIKEK